MVNNNLRSNLTVRSCRAPPDTVLVITGFEMKDYLRNTLTVRSSRASPASARKLVTSISRVVQASSASSAINVAREINPTAALSHSDREGRDQGVKVSCNSTRSTGFLSNIGQGRAQLRCFSRVLSPPCDVRPACTCMRAPELSFLLLPDIVRSAQSHIKWARTAVVGSFYLKRQGLTTKRKNDTTLLLKRSK